MQISKTDVGIGAAGLLAGAAVAFAFSRTKLAPVYMAIGLAPPALAAAIVAVKATCRKAPPKLVLPSADECRPKEGEASREATVRILTLFRDVKGVNLKFLESCTRDSSLNLDEDFIGNPAKIYAFLCSLSEGTSKVEEQVELSTVRRIGYGAEPYEALTEARACLILLPLYDMGIAPFDPIKPGIFETDRELCRLGMTLLDSPLAVGDRFELYAHTHGSSEARQNQMYDCAVAITDTSENVAAYSDKQLATWITETFEPWLADRQANG